MVVACPGCGAVNSNDAVLGIHNRAFHSESGDAWWCGVIPCDARSNDRVAMIRHVSRMPPTLPSCWTFHLLIDSGSSVRTRKERDKRMLAFSTRPLPPNHLL